MNRLTTLIVLALCTVAWGQEKPAQIPWTILFYGAADNNADGPILEFLDGVRRAIDDDPGIDLLLLIDRHERYSKDARLLGEDFTGARLFRLKKGKAERLDGGKHFPGITRERDEELDTADAANIGKFVAWGKEVSPARHYALLIYSHANGRTMCPDEQSGRDMGIAELTDEVGPEAHVDFLALELCTMGGIEIAYQWRPGARPEGERFSADVMLAIPNAGPPLDWHRAFQLIRSKGHDTSAMRPPLDPGMMTAADFGSLVIEEGLAGREAAASRGRDTAHESAACYDLKQAGSVKAAVDAFAVALARSDSRKALMGLREHGPGGRVMSYEGDGPFVDLFDLCRRAAACADFSPEVQQAAKVVMERTDTFIIDSFGMGGYAGFEAGKNGVFVALPRPGTWEKMGWYTPGPGKGREFGQWAFLKDGSNPGDGVVDSWFEMLDSWLDEPGGGVNGYVP